MPAAAPAKPAAKKKPSTPKKSSARKPTAKSSNKTTGQETGAGKAVEELRDKRAEFDQPIVDTPVAVLTGGETLSLDEKDTIEIVPTGSTVEITLGAKTVTLDREGVHSLQRHLNKIAVGM